MRTVEKKSKTIEKKTFAQNTEEKILFAFSSLPELYSNDINLLAIEFTDIARRVAYSEKLLHRVMKPYELSPNREITNGDSQKLTINWIMKTEQLAKRFIIRAFFSVNIDNFCSI